MNYEEKPSSPHRQLRIQLILLADCPRLHNVTMCLYNFNITGNTAHIITQHVIRCVTTYVWCVTLSSWNKTSYSIFIQEKQSAWKKILYSEEDSSKDAHHKAADEATEELWFRVRRSANFFRITLVTVTSHGFLLLNLWVTSPTSSKIAISFLEQKSCLLTSMSTIRLWGEERRLLWPN